MREVATKKNTMFEVDIVVPDNSTALGMAIWCAVHLTTGRKLELDFEQNVAQFMNKDDAVTFEEEWK